MKSSLLQFLIKINTLLSYLINCGLSDGLKLFFLKANKERDYKVQLKSLKYPFFIRGNTSDRLVASQVFYTKDYDISTNFKPKVIIDCGANIGLASLYFKSKYPESTVIAIEPEINNFNLLVKNMANYSNFTAVNKGIWSESCHLEIISGEDNLPWSFQVKQIEEQTDSSVEAISLLDIIKKYDLKEIDILKIDIQGAEENLFEKNAEKWLPYVKIIIIELHDRFLPLSSRPFYKVLSEYKFDTYFKGENIIATKIDD
jgi:FkbM family methyltransferase